ncbi:MAG: nucleotidyltransferase domain-containing protein [Candidatus Pacearchaeota archaeon]|jgi:predicted nucleotidyltransferase
MTDLIRFLNENPNSRKIFGKKELKIIEKQSWGVNLTQSEKNRLSRDIRKKFEFIKEISKFSDDFDLKKASTTKAMINNALEVIKEHEWFWKIKEIILFGSFVENKFHLFSDIDIAVKFKEINIKDATKFRIHILGRVNNKIDIQVYNILPDKIKKEIDKNGKTIYQKKN